MNARTVRAGRRTVQVHRPDKALFPGLFPGAGNAKEYTKGELVDHYRAVAPFTLPHPRVMLPHPRAAR